jgi:hypothetical protein
MTTLGWFLLGLGIVLDATSAVLNIRKVRFGQGPSGLPFVPLLLDVAGFTLLWLSEPQYLPLPYGWLLCASAVFHIMAQYALPALYKQLVS